MLKTNKFTITLLSLILVAFWGCSQNATTDRSNSEPAKIKFSFAYFTDVHLNKSDFRKGSEGFSQALDHAKSKNVDFFIFGGDNTDSDALEKSEEAIADSLQAAFKSIVDQTGVPSFFTIGNHDRYYWNKGDKDELGFNCFENIFGATHQSFTHKGVHFIILNSIMPSSSGEYHIDAEQLSWLANDLKTIDQSTPVIISTHVPMLSLYYPVVEGVFKGADMIANTKEVFDLIHPYNVKVVLQGHQHIYEQIYERNCWFVTAGAVSARWWQGPFMDTDEGYLLVSIDESNKVSWEYISYGWESKI